MIRSILDMSQSNADDNGTSIYFKVDSWESTSNDHLHSEIIFHLERY